MQVTVEHTGVNTVHWRDVQAGVVYQSFSDDELFVLTYQNGNEVYAVTVKSRNPAAVSHSFIPGIDTVWIPCESHLSVKSPKR